MKQSDAMDSLIKRYGLLKGSRLLQYAAILNALGPEAFDLWSSQTQRSKITREMVAADPPVHWDDIEWANGFEGWYVAWAKRTLRRARRIA